MNSSLLKKLQLKTGQKMAVVNVPEGYMAGLTKALKRIDVIAKTGGKSEAVLVFVNNLAEAKELTPNYDLKLRQKFGQVHERLAGPV